jgi:Spy/CpxP family protein refolding chaperone
LTEDVRARSLHKATERAREKEEKERRKKREREKKIRTHSPSLSSSPSFGHSTTYAEVGRRTREREKYREKKASYDPNYCRRGQQRQQQQLQCVKKQCRIVELGKR